MMIPERTVELIHVVIDGEATPEEQVELHNQASRSPEIQGAFEEFRHLSSELDSIPHPPVPPSFKYEVLSTLREKSHSTAPAKIVPFSPRRKAFVAFYAAAAVIILAVAIGPVVLNRPAASVNGVDAAGSMTPSETRSWPELGTVSSVDGGTRLTARSRSNRLALEVSGAVQGPFSIAWDRPELTVLSSTPTGARGSVSVTFPAGLQRAEVVLQTVRSPGQTAEVYVSTGEREILRMSVPLD